MGGINLPLRKQRQLDESQLQVDVLQEIIELSHARGAREKIVQRTIEWAAEQLEEVAPSTIFAALSNGDGGALKLAVLTRGGDGKVRHQVSSSPWDKVNDLIRQWQEPNPQPVHLDESLLLSLGEGIPIAGDSWVIGFPFRANNRTLGILGVVLALDRNPAEDVKARIQQFTHLAALCLHTAEVNDAQARQIRELQHEDEMRRSFISLVTHEFRTPLTSLKTCFDLIQESDEVQGMDAPYQRLLVNVNHSVATLERFVNDLAEVVNMSSGNIPLNKTTVRPEAIVLPVIDMTRPLSDLKTQNLQVDIAPDLANLVGDAPRLEQVLTNILSNAIKYTPQGGTIRTKVSGDKDFIKFEISDNGRGIPSESISQVFDPFYRVPNEARDRASGTGLGLALAKSLVESHDGEIWVESEVDQGSTFFFTIPAESQPKLT